MANFDWIHSWDPCPENFLDDSVADDQFALYDPKRFENPGKAVPVRAPGKADASTSKMGKTAAEKAKATWKAEGTKTQFTKEGHKVSKDFPLDSGHPSLSKETIKSPRTPNLSRQTSSESIKGTPVVAPSESSKTVRSTVANAPSVAPKHESPSDGRKKVNALTSAARKLIKTEIVRKACQLLVDKTMTDLRRHWVCFGCAERTLIKDGEDCMPLDENKKSCGGKVPEEQREQYNSMRAGMKKPLFGERAPTAQVRTKSAGAKPSGRHERYNTTRYASPVRDNYRDRSQSNARYQDRYEHYDDAIESQDPDGDAGFDEVRDMVWDQPQPEPGSPWAWIPYRNDPLNWNLIDPRMKSLFVILKRELGTRFTEDGDMQHTLACKPKEVREAVLARGFPYDARAPIPCLIALSNKAWRRFKNDDKTSGRNWYCRFCEESNRPGWDACNNCGAVNHIGYRAVLVERGYA